MKLNGKYNSMSTFGNIKPSIKLIYGTSLQDRKETIL